MDEKVTFFIIPHTHWDREWHLPFQKFRMNLVNLCRILTNYMEENPNYLFTFDGQSIILDDVAEIEQKLFKEIEKFAKEKRIIFGPWYVQPDEFLVSGESLTRNLLIGIKKAINASNGNYLRVGYAPDLFGHIPQLGEIFNQFKINHLIFWRGVPLEIENSEFFWISPSGNKILVTSLFQSYSNGLNLPSDPTQLEKEINFVLDSVKDKLSSPNFLLMNGTDHELPQISLGEVFKDSDTLKYHDFNLVLSSLEEYSKKILKIFGTLENNKNLQEIKGELRNSYRAPILSGILSARMYLKKENAYLERLLEDYLIPLNSVLFIKTGLDYSENINFLAEKLIENHSHDCICGCSVDIVHEEMEQRFKSIKQMGESILESIKQKLSSGLDFKDKKAENIESQIGIVNPQSYNFSGILPVNFEPNFKVDTEKKIIYEPLKLGSYHVKDLSDNSITVVNFEEEREIIIKDHAIGRYHINRLSETIANLSRLNWYPVNSRSEIVNGKQIFTFEFSRRKTNRIIDSQEIVELFKDLKIEKNEFIQVIFKSIPFMVGKFEIKNLKPFSFKFFSLVSYKDDSNNGLTKEEIIKFSPFNIDFTNENRIGLHIKLGEQTFFIENLIKFEDLGDRGDEYNFCPLEQDAPIYPQLKQWAIAEANSLYLKLRLDYDYILPTELSADRNLRSEITSNNPFNICITFFSHNLDTKSNQFPQIDFTVNFFNKMKDHRLRALISLPMDINSYFTSSSYYVVKREKNLINQGDILKDSIEKPSKTVPQKEFSTFKNENNNLALTIINKGLPELEYKFETSEIALTLLRAVGWLSRSDLSTRNGHAGPGLATPGAQCLKENVANFSLIFHTKRTKWSELYQITKNILSPPISFPMSEAMNFEKESELFKIQSENFIMTSFEKIQDGFLIRGLNYSESKEQIEISTSLKGYFYKITNLEDVIIKNYSVYNETEKITDEISPWEIKNYFFKMIE